MEMQFDHLYNAKENIYLVIQGDLLELTKSMSLLDRARTHPGIKDIWQILTDTDSI